MRITAVIFVMAFIHFVKWKPFGSFTGTIHCLLSHCLGANNNWKSEVQHSKLENLLVTTSLQCNVNQYNYY